jgi:hypothetical protein
VSALAVYLFQFEMTEMFVLSLYREAHNLPTGLCQAGLRVQAVPIANDARRLAAKVGMLRARERRPPIRLDRLLARRLLQ